MFVCDASSCPPPHSFSYFHASDLIRHCRAHHPNNVPSSVPFSQCVPCSLPFTISCLRSHVCNSQSVTVPATNQSSSDGTSASEAVAGMDVSGVSVADENGSGVSDASEGTLGNLSNLLSAGSFPSQTPFSIVLDSLASEQSSPFPGSVGPSLQSPTQRRSRPRSPPRD